MTKENPMPAKQFATTTDLPKVGDRFKCETCGMCLVCEADCGCTDLTCVSLQCCGKPLVKENVPC